MCERLLRLQKPGSPRVGEATVFCSQLVPRHDDRHAARRPRPLSQAAGAEGERHVLLGVCDYVIRQTDVKTDLKRLGDCVSAVGHTVLLMEPCHAPAPLKRAYCIKEVYHTQESGAQFDVVMSSEQQVALEAALRTDFASIQTSLARWMCAPPSAATPTTPRPF